MLDRCDFRDLRECSCGPNECRVQNIGTVRRTNDVSDVFTLPAWDQIIRLLFVGTIIGLGFGFSEMSEQQKRMDIIAQEQGHGR